MENKPFNNKDIKKAIHRSQHTQRNWDLSKEVPQEDLDLILESVTQCPSKQNRPYYKVHAITNRDMIEKIHSKTEGFGLLFTEDGVKSQTNPQTLANVVLVFERNEEVKNPYDKVHGKLHDTAQRDTDMAVGIAAGYCNIVSSMMGYRTGCCLCFNPQDMKETIGLEGEPLLIMGVGHAKEGVSRRVHHMDESYKFTTNRKHKIAVKHVA